MYRKVSFVGTALLSLDRMRSVLSQVVTCDPGDLEVSRIDFAVDVPNVPVSWFHYHTYARRKQTYCTITKVSPSGVGPIQTIYLGKRPNCIRIYDKIAERSKKQNNKGEHALLTRVERQCSGRGVPLSLSRFCMLAQAITETPFSTLSFVANKLAGVMPGAGTANQLLGTLGLRTLIEEAGLQTAIRILNSCSKNNARRILKRFGTQAPLGPWQIPDLNEAYRVSATRQLRPGWGLESS